MNASVPKWLKNIDLKKVESPTGNQLHCLNWETEAALRMLLNNLDHRVAENPEELIVYGGLGKAARNPEALQVIFQQLLNLKNNETLLIQSGKAVGVIRSHPMAPRILIANSNLVPHWANWDHFFELEKKGLMMYGQMTAGSWIYIGSQGIIQGTFETFLSAARKHYGEQANLAGKLVISAGLGGMGGAQPLAVKLAGGVCIMAEMDESRIKKRLSTAYLDTQAPTIEAAIELALQKKAEKIPYSIGVLANAIDLLKTLKAKNIIPDLLTDQTSAHDPLNGYWPEGHTLNQAQSLKKENVDLFLKKVKESIKYHVTLMNEFQKLGSHVFDYGNNIRGQAHLAGHPSAFEFDGFVPLYIRPLFCEGKGPFRFVALSGDPEDILVCDQALLEIFPEDLHLKTWILGAQKNISFQGLPARICWLGMGAREKAALKFHELVKNKKLKAPIVIGRDHLDCGSVASPYRETEKMIDGSDAVSDWAILNALSNASCGATWVSFHHGGGVGMGFSQHAGMVILVDGSPENYHKLKAVMHNDPLLGVIRHADAGYELAKDCAQKNNILIPHQLFK